MDATNNSDRTVVALATVDYPGIERELEAVLINLAGSCTVVVPKDRFSLGCVLRANVVRKRTQKPELETVVVAADWNAHGRSAYAVRDEQMLTMRPSLLVATTTKFVHGETESDKKSNRGVGFTVARFKRAGVEVQHVVVEYHSSKKTYEGDCNLETGWGWICNRKPLPGSLRCGDHQKCARFKSCKNPVTHVCYGSQMNLFCGMSLCQEHKDCSSCTTL